MVTMVRTVPGTYRVRTVAARFSPFSDNATSSPIHQANLSLPPAQTIVLSPDSGAGPRQRSRDYLLLITLPSQTRALRQAQTRVRIVQLF
jgi:hypothetical protein